MQRVCLENEQLVGGPDFTAIAESLGSPLMPAKEAKTVEFLLVLGYTIRVKVLFVKNADKIGNLFHIQGLRMDGGLVLITNYDIKTCNSGTVSDLESAITATTTMNIITTK